jgi:hypothetical protein
MNKLRGGWIDYRTAKPPQFTRDSVRPLPAFGRLSLGRAEAGDLRQAAVACSRNPYVAEETEEFIQQAERAYSECFSLNTREAVAEILDHGFGAVLLENVPADFGLPSTPLAGGALDPGFKETFVSEFSAVAIGALAHAQIFNFRQEGRGSAPLFDNVVPVKKLRAHRGGGGFDNNFPFHCESTWHRMRPDYGVLLGIREDPGALTLISSVSEIITEQLVESMPIDSYRLKAPELYSQMAAEDIPLGTPLYRTMPPIVVSDPVTINVNFNGTDCLGQGVVEWLAGLERVVEEKAASVVLGSGNALIFNNHRACHTRTGFDPNFGPDARWFLRANFKKDLWSHKSGNAAADISNSDLERMTAHGWVDGQGNLTRSFLPYVDNPRAINDLSETLRNLVAKALHLTPVPGSRIV